MAEIRDVEVRFDIWCKKCKDAKTPEEKDPCNECMDHFYNQGSTKPIYFKEK